MNYGTVKWFSESEGYGFITIGPELRSELKLPREKDLFVCAEHIDRAPRVLYEGERVNFIVARTARGPRAVTVRVIKKYPQRRD